MNSNLRQDLNWNAYFLKGKFCQVILLLNVILNFFNLKSEKADFFY